MDDVLIGSSFGALADMLPDTPSARPVITDEVITHAFIVHAGLPQDTSGMHVWQATIVDSAGNIQPGALVEVRSALTQELAPIYWDRDGESMKNNPFTVGNDAFAQFYAPTGRYRIRAAFGAAQRVWNDVELGVTLDSLPDISGIIRSTVNSMISSAVASQLAGALADLASLPSAGIYSGFVGHVSNTNSLPAGWSYSRMSTGVYEVTHDLGLSDPKSLDVVATPDIAGQGAASEVRSAHVTNRQANKFTVRIVQPSAGSDIPRDADFAFVAVNREGEASTA